MEPLAFIIAIAHIAAAVALFNGFVVALAQGKVVCTALESIARQPEAAGNVRTSMLIGLAVCETAGIYGLLISIIMLFTNPLVNIYISNMVK